MMLDQPGPLLRQYFLPAFCVVFLALVDLAAATSAAWAADDKAMHAPQKTLTIGRVSGNPRKHAGRLMAFGEYLTDRLGADFRTRAEIVMDADVQNVLAAAARGEIDVISETVFTAARLENTGKMEIMLLEWKRNVTRYRSALIVQKDSDIRSISDLRGRTVAFEDPGSTSGFFLPYLEIMDAGLDLSPVGVRSPDNMTVLYAFSGSEVNVVGSVVRGRMDVGAISETDLDDPEVMTERFRPKLRVFHLTQWVPRSVLLVRRSLPPAMKSRLREVLLAMHLDESAAPVMKRYFGVSRYVEVDPATDAALDRIRDAVRQRHGG